MLLGILLLFLGISCIVTAAFNIGKVGFQPETENEQQQYNTSITVMAVAFAVILTGVLMISTNWNPLGSLGDFTIQQPKQSPLGDLL